MYAPTSRPEALLSRFLSLLAASLRAYLFDTFPVGLGTR